MIDNKAPLSPASPVFKALNWIAAIGWLVVLINLAKGDKVKNLVIGLECICLVEVIRIILGQIPGNLILGIVLHYIRMVTLLIVLKEDDESDDDDNHWTVGAVYFSWAGTFGGWIGLCINCELT